ncbi:MAG: glycerophosphodiester phosphodiesterase [Wujia sp.]
MIPLVIAHRGASALASHENTLEAFQIAIQLQADYAEFDIRRTKDRQLIAFHNPSLNDRPIRELTYQNLCSITASDGYRIPRLEEVLELCRGKIKLDIELKESGYEQDVVNLVQRYYDYSNYMMKSFLDRCVLHIKEIDPNIQAGLLIGSTRNTLVHRLNEYFPIHRLLTCKADFISPYYQFVTHEFVWRMHLHKKQIYVWTVNEPERIQKLMKRQVDGIITDRPDLALQLRSVYSKKKHRKES